jgi:hypothetical protein
MERFYDYNTVTEMSISKKDMKKDCSDVIRILKKNNINCTVTSNTTLFLKNGKINEENGCNINIFGIKEKYIKPLVWIPLKYGLLLDCAHLKIYENDELLFNGCIKGFSKDFM